MDAYEKKRYYRVGTVGHDNHGSVLRGKGALTSEIKGAYSNWSSGKPHYIFSPHSDNREIIEYELKEIRRFTAKEYVEELLSKKK
jgi:hypothetical protein